MLTREESEYLRRIVAEYEQHDGTRIEIMRAINRATDTYAPNQGTDVIAKGPIDRSTRQMLDEAARALGWRTDFATGDSPITWELVLEAIRKHVRHRPQDESSPSYKWRTYDVSGKPAGTIGYDDGNRMYKNLENKLRQLEATEEEVFSVNIVSSCCAFIVTRQKVK